MAPVTPQSSSDLPRLPSASRASIVFGAGGFIGTHPLRRQIAAGADRVVLVNIYDPRAAVAGVEYRRADVRDLADFAESLVLLQATAARQEANG